MQAQLERGKKHEYDLDAIFKKDWKIEELTLDQERAGMGDRRFTNRQTGESLLIEYKADESAARIGNAFVETISVDSTNKPGWAYTCQADYIFYYLPLDGLIYIYRPCTIRRHLPEWQKQFKTAHTNKGQNDGYNTHGVLVPLGEFERCADKVVNL